jgi:hypothetical protein
MNIHMAVNFIIQQIDIALSNVILQCGQQKEIKGGYEKQNL